MAKRTISKSLKTIRQAWITGHAPDMLSKEEAKQPSIYTMAQSLGFSLYDQISWLDSEEMVKWITENKDTKYVPERLLKILGLCTVWDIDFVKPTTLVPADREFTDLSVIEIA